MEKKSYRVDEVADEWAVSRRTVERLIKKGDLEAFKVRNSTRIKREDVEQYEKKKRL